MVYGVTQYLKDYNRKLENCTDDILVVGLPLLRIEVGFASLSRNLQHTQTYLRVVCIHFKCTPSHKKFCNKAKTPETKNTCFEGLLVKVKFMCY